MTTDIKTWYKQTKMGIIPNDWDYSKFSHIADLFHWYQFRDYDFTNSWIPVIKISNVNNGKLNFDNITYISAERLDEFDKYKINNWDVLMSLTWNIWRVVIVDWLVSPCLQNYRVWKFIPLWNIDKTFMSYIMSSDSFLKQLNKNANQTAQANFWKQDMDKLDIVFPSNQTEQHKIADVLSSVDELIEKTDKVIETQKKLKEGLLIKLMREENDKIKTKKLKDIAKFSQWIQVDLDQQKTSPWDWYERFLRIVDYTQETKDLRYIIFPWEKYLTNEDDVVMVRYWASAGFIGTGKKWIIANNMFKVDTNWEVLNKYLYFFLKQNKVAKIITQMSTASAMPQLNFTMVWSIEITYPEDIKEQQKIVDMFVSIDSSIKDEEHYKDSLKILKKGLMDKLLVGEIRVKI